MHKLLLFAGLLAILAVFEDIVPEDARSAMAQAQPATAEGVASIPDEAQATRALRSSPLMFIESVGQFDEGARFQVWGGPGSAMWLADDAIWITVVETLAPDASPSGFGPLRYFGRERVDQQPAEVLCQGANIKLSFVDANPHPRLEPFDRLDTVVSYLIGNDRAQWHPTVSVWRGVRYVGLYPGVDLELTGEDGRLVPRLAVLPGGDLSAVRLRVEGAEAVALEGDALRLSTAAGDAIWPLLQAEGLTTEAVVQSVGAGMSDVTAPFSASSRTPSASSYAPSADNPVDLVYSTFLGGGDYDRSNGIVADGSGAVYLTGSTDSGDFPTTVGAFDPDFNGGDYDVFVAKLNPAGSALAWATFVGGNDWDYARSIVLDGSGAVYLTGATWSSDFPTTAGAYDQTFNGGGSDVFVVKLNAAGSALGYATFVGGTDHEYAMGIAVDGSGAAYVTGMSYSSDYPTTLGAFQTTYGGRGADLGDVIVTKLNAAGSNLVYSTYLGASSGEYGRGLALDASGAAYIAGYSCSSDFPTTPGAFDRILDGDNDAYVTKLNAAGSALVYSTFLGGSDNDASQAIALGESGAAYVVGQTVSSDFPVTAGAFDTTFEGGGEYNTDGFVAKLSIDGSSLAYATFLGGSGGEEGRGVVVDGSGAAYVTGSTNSDDFPMTVGAYDTGFNGSEDAYVVKLNGTGSGLDYATFLGGSDDDSALGIALGGIGVVYASGTTKSANFPVTAGAYDTSFSGDFSDAFVLKLAKGSVYDYSVCLPLVLRNR